MQITIHSKGVQQGPLPAEQVKQLLQNSQISPTDLGWAPGMEEWKPLSSFQELQTTSTPPPVPGREIPPPIAQQRATEPLAIWSLVLGIVSVVGCTFGGIIAGIPAIICGHIGRSKIQNNPALRGAGMALAGLICGYLSVAVVPIAIIAAIAIPNIAQITQSAEAATSRRNAQQLASTASAARAAGYTGHWASKDDAIRDLTSGISFNSLNFSVGPMTPKASQQASEHLRLEGDQLVFVP